MHKYSRTIGMSLGYALFATLGIGLPLTNFSAQAQQSGQELELPETDIRQPAGVSIRIDHDVSFASECPFESSDLTVNLQDIEFLGTGGGALDARLARQLYGVDVPSGERSVSVICEINDAANRALRDGGWIATASLPPQELTDTLHLQVSTGALNTVKIEGDPGPYRDFLNGLVERLQKLSPLNERDIERVLLNATDIPGLDVRLSLAPSSAGPGLVDGTLTVDFTPYAAFLNVRNYNARSVGRETGFARVEVYGLTGLSDLSYIGAQTTLDFDEQFVLQAGHEFGLGANNLRFGANVVYAESRPSVTGLDVQTDTLVANTFTSYPLIRRPDKALDIRLGFDFIEQKTDVGPLTLSKDSLRTLFLSAELDGQKRRFDRSTAFLYNGFIEIRQGISGLDATENGISGFAETDGFVASRPFGQANATVLRGGANVTWLPTPLFEVRSKIEGQWANDPLLSFDEFAVGNLSIGRGYDPGANSGDRAIGGQFEIGANVPVLAQNGLQFFGFFDVIHIENLDPEILDATRTLQSVGGGARYRFANGLSAELIYAVPLDPALATDAEAPPDRVLFSITTTFPNLFRSLRSR